MFTGKYESNIIAQQLVAHYADHTIEGLELLSEVRGMEQEDDAGLRTDVADERARAVLLKLEEATRPDSGLALVHTPYIKSTGTSANPCPWEDSSGYSQTTGYHLKNVTTRDLLRHSMSIILGQRPLQAWAQHRACHRVQMVRRPRRSAVLQDKTSHRDRRSRG